jgi:putative membrane protein
MLMVIFIWSVIHPVDGFTWFLEMIPVVLGLMVLLTTARRFPLTNLSYVLIFFHCVILLVGAHYTYAKVPMFDWIRDVFDLSRNHYDRLGHVTQGFVPAMLTREILIRTSPLRKSRWLMPLTISVCLSISAIYELFEWAVAELTGTAAEAFLGTQGDVWDTQKDMAFCLVGAMVSLLLLSRLQDRQLSRMASKQTDRP